MKLLGINFGKEEVKQPVTAPLKEDVRTTGQSVVKFARTELPVVIENKKNDWVLLGENHYYPQFLKQLSYKSAIHNAIITGKAQMQAGKGLLLNGTVDKGTSDDVLKALPIEVQNKYNQFLKNPNDTDSLMEIIRKISLDFQVQGAFALEIIWSLDYSSIATIKYVEVDKIAPGKYSGGKINEYYFCEDWATYKKCGVKKIQAFCPEEPNKEYSQLLYVKRGSLDYFGTPAYIGAIEWINVDIQMGTFHSNNINNGFAPSLVMKYYGAVTPEQQQYITQNFKAQYKGAENAGKAIMFFSRDKETAPEIQPLELSNIDKQYIAISDTAVQRILTGHKVTSPELFGIAIPGKLGTSTLEEAFKIYDTTVVEPDRNVIEEMLNKLLKVNKIPVTVKIDKFTPFGVTEVVDDAGAPVLATIFGVGGTQSIISILTDSILSAEQKKGTLMVLFGLTEEDVNKMLPVVPTTTNPTTPTV